MDWYPLKLTFHVRTYAFGERLIAEMLGKQALPEGVVAETWEISDHRDARATITNGSMAGSSFHDVVMNYPQELVGEGWNGPHFPLLAKFLDASHPLPVHLHADDETAIRLHREPHGKSEAWHILWAAPEATILAGVNPDLTHDELFDAFKRRDYDSVMYRYPISPGDTVYVPGGILHAFGPDTLIFEIQQTSDLGQTVMPDDLYGNIKSAAQWDDDIRKSLAELKTDYFPSPNPGLTFDRGGNRYTTGCAGPYFALERWSLKHAHHQPAHDDRCFTISNVGDPVSIRFDGGEEQLDRAESCVIPAALEPFDVSPLHQLADLIVCYVPDLERDIIAPLRAARFDDQAIGNLGMVADLDACPSARPSRSIANSSGHVIRNRLGWFPDRKPSEHARRLPLVKRSYQGIIVFHISSSSSELNETLPESPVPPSEAAKDVPSPSDEPSSPPIDAPEMLLAEPPVPVPATPV